MLERARTRETIKGKEMYTCACIDAYSAPDKAIQVLRAVRGLSGGAVCACCYAPKVARDTKSPFTIDTPDTRCRCLYARQTP